jgi:dephospho-CoA kinase
MLRARGIPVLDADVIARRVVAPGSPAHAEILAAWPDVRARDGSIDRRALGAKVFSDPAARARLEAITHPRIAEGAAEEARALEAAGHRLAFYEASLLVETGRYREFDALVVVSAPEELQVARVMARDGLGREAAVSRLRAQMPLADKRRVASHVLENAGDLAALEAQVDALVAALSSEGDK